MMLLSLGEIRRNQELLLKLSFPARKMDYSLKVLSELEEVGVDGIYVEEASTGLEIVIVGKGHRGIVVKGRMMGVEAAIKILRTDTKFAGLDREAEATAAANMVGVGPKLLGHSQNALIMEYIFGEHFGKWVDGLDIKDRDVLRRVLRRCFLQARALDILGLDHGELSDARKHVIVAPDLNSVIIDFGKARVKDRPSNVTSLFSYTVFGPNSRKIIQMLGLEDPPIYASKNYKRSFDEKSFHELMVALKL